MLNSIILEEKTNLIKTPNIWANSEFEWLKNLSSTKKGSIGETVVKNFLLKKGQNVTKYKGLEYDLTYLNEKIEVKLSMLNNTGYFKFLQIRLDDSYTHIALLCIEPNISKVFIIPKNKLINLKPQHSGKRGNNNIMYLGIRPKELYSLYQKYEL